MATDGAQAMHDTPTASHTQTQTVAPPLAQDASIPTPSTSNPTPTPVVGTLRLRGQGGGNTTRVQWDDEVIDNEFMGRKKSKICCIYHKPKAFDESSGDESDSSVESCGSNDSRRGHAHPHRGHDADGGPGLARREGAGGGGGGTEEVEGSGPNAYEKSGGGGKGKGKA